MLASSRLTIFFMLIVTSALTAYGSEPGTYPGFDIQCRFQSTGCSATGRIFKTRYFGDEPLQPEWGANFLEISCGRESVFSGTAVVARDGSGWKIRDLNGDVSLDLGGSAFNRSPNVKTVAAILESPEGENDRGICRIGSLSNPNTK